MHTRSWPFFLLCVVSLSSPLYSESKSGEYPGVADPFGDPSQYEFSEEEKDDKEFFHLGRFLLLGADLGAGIFTGGLGSSTVTGFLAGGHLVYFFDKALAFEFRGSYSNHLDQVRNSADINTDLIALTGGFRYYFDTKNTPRAIAIANPYLGLGGGLYMRNQTVIAGTATVHPSSSFGIFGAGGVQAVD